MTPQQERILAVLRSSREPLTYRALAARLGGRATRGSVAVQLHHIRRQLPVDIAIETRGGPQGFALVEGAAPR
ncbi:hypothetical protein [Sphingomonas sp.]|uniref:hypothetical protein n=1 Tax=Sphingomonas sp. TaxID=28214 RepID=UPI003CC63D1B